MGAFFTNVQLKTSGFEKTDLLEKVIEFITKYNFEAGFIKVENEDEADKTVIISPSENSNWIAIYDEETEDQGSKKLNKLTSALSKEFKSTALSVLVNDSDLINVGLYINGTLKDKISNLTKEFDFIECKPQVWNEILVDKFSFSDIEKAWKNKKIFIEDFLTLFANLTGLDNSKLLTGYEYLNKENPNDGIKLNYAYKEKKKVADLELTKFGLISGGGVVDVQPKEKLDKEWLLTNYGTSSKGLDIIIGGKCIEEGLLIPEIAISSYSKKNSEQQNEFIVKFIETVSTTGDKIFYTQIEDIYIPKGFQPIYPMTPKEGKQYSKIRWDCAIRISISFIGGEQGTGEFDVYFSPIVNRQNGTFIQTLMKGTLEDWIKKNAH